MSLIIDTGLFYAHQDEDASCRGMTNRVLRETLESEFGRLYTSDYIHDQAITLVRKQIGTFENAKTASNRITGTDSIAPIKPLFVDELSVNRSLDVSDRYSDHDLSFTDATTFNLVEAHNIDAVLSFDDDFDGIVDRLDSEELA